MFRSLLNGGGSWVAVSRRLPSSVARDDTVGFASRTLCIRKILLTGDALEDIDYMPYPGLEDLTAKADEKAVAAVLADMDTAARTYDDAKMLAAIGLEGASREVNCPTVGQGSRAPGVSV